MDSSRLAICICATKSYTYALKAQARKVIACISSCTRIKEGCIILVGDESEELKDAEKFYNKKLPTNFEVRRITIDAEDGLPNYQKSAQLVIARLRSEAFDEAKRDGFDYCWSLDSDVLPPHNALQCMMQMLEFDDGFYGVACCPYMSQGGGDFLGGRGTEQNPILPDVYEDERLLSKELEKRIEKFKEDIKSLGGKESEELQKERKEIAEDIQRSPSKGDIFFLNSNSGIRPFVGKLKELIKDTWPDGNHSELIALIEQEEAKWKPLGFRRRGWLSAAYPGLGLGCIVPVDWFGFGCNLMNKKALALAQFEGYEGGGTEDLYVIRKKWLRNHIRLAVIPHCPCDHVIRDTENPGEFKLLQVYHETQNQECLGHLRREIRPWFQQVDGEKAKDPKPPAEKT